MSAAFPVSHSVHIRTRCCHPETHFFWKETPTVRTPILNVGIVAALFTTAVTAAETADPLDMIFARQSDVAVFGDAPYGTTPTDTAQFAVFPSFIQSINADPDVSLVLLVGDIHSGKQFRT